MLLIVRPRAKQATAPLAPLPPAITPATEAEPARPRYNPLRIFHNSGLFIAIDLPAWGRSLEEVLGKCEAQIADAESTGMIMRKPCGCTVTAYEKGVEEQAFEWNGRAVIIRKVA